jgi:hypothetical protein
MMFLRRGSTRDLFWNFARAEFEVPAHGLRHTQPVFSQALRDRVLQDERATFSDEDWDALGKAVLSVRSDIVQPLLDSGAAWFLGELPSKEWANLRVMNLRMFANIAPSRRLIDLTAALDRGAVPLGWKPSNYPQLRSTFDLPFMHGTPIVVAPESTGPYTLVEGVTRMCVLLSKNNLGEIDVPSIPMLLGVNPRWAEWEFF